MYEQVVCSHSRGQTCTFLTLPVKYYVFYPQITVAWDSCYCNKVHPRGILIRQPPLPWNYFENLIKSSAKNAWSHSSGEADLSEVESKYRLVVWRSRELVEDSTRDGRNTCKQSTVQAVNTVYLSIIKLIWSWRYTLHRCRLVVRRLVVLLLVIMEVLLWNTSLDRLKFELVGEITR